MTDFLERILASRREAVEAARAAVGEAEVRREAGLRTEPRDFRAALREPGTSLIAEIKRASPSRGPLNPDIDPIVQAAAYEQGGARALSVLTEPDFFKGSPQDLVEARGVTRLPTLWKDFVIDRYQVLQARAHAADAVLLIVRILSDETLSELLDETRSLGMCALVEVFDDTDVKRALAVGADVVGINHRDLATFEEDAETTVRLRPLLPDRVSVVAESAIRTRADVEAYETIGVDAVLVGEALVRASDPAAKVRELVGG